MSIEHSRLHSYSHPHRFVIPTGTGRPGTRASTAAGLSTDEHRSSIASTVSTKSSVQPQPLPPTPAFESVPVRWKGLTMEAAKWTFSSQELQEIAARAIRLSAEESSVRLLPLEVLDTELPEETERLELLRDDIKTKYKHQIRRRRLLMRSLALYIDGSDVDTARRLSDELSQASVTCDQLCEDLFLVTDQLSQIARLRDNHSSSALAMALRKLNTSFIRSTGEVCDLTIQLATLEAERDEAWLTAEAVERELDELQQQYANMAAPLGPLLPPPPASSLSVPMPVPVPVSAPVPLPPLVPSNSTPTRSDSARSSNRSSRVSAARKTSTRASKASLRMSTSAPRSARLSVGSFRYLFPQSPGLSVFSGVSDDVPPVPQVPTNLSSENLRSRFRVDSTTTTSRFVSTPSSASRAMISAQNDLLEMLGMSLYDLTGKPERRRSFSDVGHPEVTPFSPRSPGFDTSLPPSPGSQHIRRVGSMDDLTKSKSSRRQGMIDNVSQPVLKPVFELNSNVVSFYFSRPALSYPSCLWLKTINNLSYSTSNCLFCVMSFLSFYSQHVFECIVIYLPSI